MSVCTIDEFLVVKQLDRGFTCSVVEAHYMNRRFALKVYYADKVNYARRQFELACRLNHPYIIQFLQLREAAVMRQQQQESVCCIAVIELAAGGPLNRLKNVLTEEAARTYFRMLLEAVKHMHGNMVFHMDIKPHNILLDDMYRLKLSDFGMSSTQEFWNLRAGTDGYMAPQVADNVRYDCQLADSFSCGVVLFELLFGIKPFKSSSFNDPMRQLLHFRPDVFWSSLQASEQLKDLIGGMLNMDIRKRYRLEQVMEHPWLSGDQMMMDEMAGMITKY